MGHVAPMWRAAKIAAPHKGTDVCMRIIILRRKKIYNAHIVKHKHELEGRAVARWPDAVC